jgi:hypothetical protein
MTPWGHGPNGALTTWEAVLLMAPWCQGAMALGEEG